MPKNKTTSEARILTPRHLVTLLEASPEGFFHRTKLNDPKLGAGGRAEVIAEALNDGLIGQEGDYLYALDRLNADELRRRSAEYPGSIPPLKLDGRPAVRSIPERFSIREERLTTLDDPALNRLLNRFEGTEGYLPREQVVLEAGDETHLLTLIQANLLKSSEGIIFDPLRISRESVDHILERRVVLPAREAMIAQLRESPAQTLPRAALVEAYGFKLLEKALAYGGLRLFNVPSPRGEVAWVTLSEADEVTPYNFAVEAVQPKDSDWEALLTLCGNRLKEDAVEGLTFREKVIARTYILPHAAKQIGVKESTLQTAITEHSLSSILDPEGKLRVAVVEVKDILAHPAHQIAIEDLELLHLREVKLAFGEAEARAILERIRRRGHVKLRWGALRDVLHGTEYAELTLAAFHERVQGGRDDWKQTETLRKEQQRRQRDEDRRRRDTERRQKEELRAKLLAAFPTWAHPGRADQRVVIHVGPTNSGKTHHALEALVAAGSGWYLAPLRLLAYEIFDRLNRRGVYCNLLTGEEYIPVPGAQITASTIEMFNPQNSGELVIIDEAHMLADADRGWAWTRAFMEARSPLIRVITPPFARTLIERLVKEAEMQCEVVTHERLTPLEIAPRPWSLEHMPPKTILVAFSRKMVLRLKTELERYGRRVSVIYGNLPPEVRRRQADRFAQGETEICVATDAVGMGLNLPADNVCFYELEKYDGKNVRLLSTMEIRQIGGRAGRFGYASAGLIGAVERGGLKLLRQLYETEPDALEHARVAPEVEDLEMIPGSLAHRFAQWRELESIPDSLRDVIEPADIDERIALAQMLSDSDVEKIGLAAAVRW